MPPIKIWVLALRRCLWKASALCVTILEFGIWDVGFGIWNLGFGIWDLGFGIWNLGFGIWDLGFGIWDLEFGIWDSQSLIFLFISSTILKAAGQMATFFKVKLLICWNFFLSVCGNSRQAFGLTS